MDLTFPNVAALIGLAFVFTMLVYVGALRSQYRAAEAERARARASEEALREQENWFRVVFDGTSDLMALHRVEADGRLVFEYINRSLLEFHAASRPGIDASLWIGRDLADVMRTDLGYGEARIDTLLRPYRDALRTGVGTHFSHRSGEEPTARFRESLVTPLKDAGGGVVRLFYRGTDVTERRRSEGEIRSSTERFSSLLATSPVPIIITRLSDSLILEVSDSWTDTVGIPREQAVGRTVRELGLWVTQDEREAVVGRLEAGRPILRLKTRFRIASGQLHTLLYSASLITWNDEPAVMAFPLDVQELEDAKLEAQASSERFRQLFELSPVPTIITSLAENRILLVNEAWAAATGVPRAQAIGQRGETIGHWADPAVREEFLARLRAGERLYGFPARFRHSSGEIRDFLSWGELGTWHGEPCTLVTRVDVTELVRTRARAEASEAKLKEEQRLSRSMMDNSSDLMAIYQIDGDRLLISEWNRALRRFYAEFAPGVNVEDWIGRPVDEFLSEVSKLSAQEIEQRLRPFQVAAAAHLPSAYQTSLPGPRGPQYRDALIVPLTDATGRVTHLFYRATDVTARRKAEEETRRNADRFAGMFNLIPNPLAIANLGTARLIAVNDAWQRLYGWRAEEVTGRTALEIGLWADPADRAGFVDSIKREGRLRPTVYRLKTRNGSEVTSLTTAEIIEWEDERALLFSNHDLTEIDALRRDAQTMGERFEKLFHTSPVPTLITRLSDGRILEMNDAYLRANSRPGEQLLGSTSQSLNMWTDPADREKFVADITAGRPVRNRRMQFRNGRGEVRDYLYSAEPIDWYGEQAVVSFPVDVTELEAARRAAQALGARLASLVEASPVPIVVTRMSDATIAQANQAWLDFTGHSRETIARGTTTSALGLWPDPQERERIVRLLGRRETVHQVPVKHRRADGDVRNVLYSAEVIGWDDGPGVVAFPFDITELERMRSEAQASSERFEKVFELSPMPIVIGAAADGRYLAVNEGWLRLHGYARAELEGETSLSLRVWANPADRQRVHDMLSRGIEVRRLPMRFRRKSGEIFDTLYSASIIDWKGTRAIIATPQDVTELNRAAEEIRRLNESLEDKVRQRTAALEEANRGLEAFSYSVSHDLRAPLRALSGFSALLAARPSVGADNEALGYAQRVNAAASRMGTIVDALLNFSRLSRQELVLRPVDLAGTIDSVIAELAQASAGRRLRWTVGDLPVVNGDPTLLRLVLQNLLDNAVKYTRNREEALIEVDATRSEGEIVIRVKDNGTGFDMQYADKLFGVFERLHTDSEFEGTGIGLANAQRIVQRHGGRIWCGAKPGAGACFYVALPA